MAAVLPVVTAVSFRIHNFDHIAARISHDDAAAVQQNFLHGFDHQASACDFRRGLVLGVDGFENRGIAFRLRYFFGAVCFGLLYGFIGAAARPWAKISF